MPTVCCIGEAAGCAMGMAAKAHTDVRQVPVKQVQAALKSRGAYLGI